MIRLPDSRTRTLYSRRTVLRALLKVAFGPMVTNYLHTCCDAHVGLLWIPRGT